MPSTAVFQAVVPNVEVSSTAILSVVVRSLKYCDTSRPSSQIAALAPIANGIRSSQSGCSNGGGDAVHDRREVHCARRGDIKDEDGGDVGERLGCDWLDLHISHPDGSDRKSTRLNS